MMDSNHSVSLSIRNSSILVEFQSPTHKLTAQNGFSSGMGILRKDPILGNGGFVGILEVHIHQARDIHNICIYHKQDVYAKLCLTSDPEVTVQTKIINGGGRNPVFSETLRLDVRTIESSLKCEIWMLSRVKNYLEDQLLGFALVPLSDIVVGNGSLEQEFQLSSTDLFHSPAGFVQLSVSYTGSSPEVLAIPAPTSSVSSDTAILDSEADANSLPSEYDKLEFPDLKVVNENQIMVSEYIGLPCSELEPQSNESLVSSENDNHPSSGIAHVVESFSSGSLDTVETLKSDTPPSSVSTNGSPSTPVPTSSQSVCGSLGASSKSPNQDNISSQEEKHADVVEGEADSSAAAPNKASVQSVLNIKVPEQPVVQQDFVDLYMKSMQQFTESLAKMKLPMDIENDSPKKEDDNSGTDQKLQATKGNGSRVFYGSRAFF